MTNVPPSQAGFECCLDEPARAEQAARWQKLAGIGRDRAASGHSFQVSFDPSCRAEVTALVAIERGCCGWAEWSLREEGDRLVLEVSGPPTEVAALARSFGA